MTTTIVTPDLDALVTEIDIAAPVERVFKSLIDPAQLKRWFTGPACPVKTWNMDARLGGKYDYATGKGSSSTGSASSNATVRFSKSPSARSGKRARRA